MRVIGINMKHGVPSVEETLLERAKELGLRVIGDETAAAVFCTTEELDVIEKTFSAAEFSVKFIDAGDTQEISAINGLSVQDDMQPGEQSKSYTRAHSLYCTLGEVVKLVLLAENSDDEALKETAGLCIKTLQTEMKNVKKALGVEVPEDWNGRHQMLETVRKDKHVVARNLAD